MMGKIIGCLLIEAGSLLYGALCVYKKRRKLEVLSSFQTMYLVLKSRISYGSASLEEIFQNLLDQGGILTDFFKNVLSCLQENDSVNFADIWIGNIERQKSWYLLKEEQKELEELGHYLGGVDRKEQLDQIQLHLELLQFRLQKEREGRASYQRFVLGLSSLMGMMIIVLIL